MSDFGLSSAELGLTKIETYQVQNRENDPSQVNFFRDNKELRRNIIANPFSRSTLDHVTKAVGENNTYITLRSAILAEQSGSYEQAVRRLTHKEQEQKLYEQMDVSAEMTIRIQKNIEDRLTTIDTVSNEDLYSDLCYIAFETREEAEIQTRFALSQRRGFRLSIANFLEERQKLSYYKEEALLQPKLFAEKYLKQKFSEQISIEQLPIGFVIYLDEQDYALMTTGDKKPQNILSRGTVLGDEWLQQDLRRKIILINKGGIKVGFKTPQSLLETRRHEIRHLIFSQFHEQQNRIFLPETKEALLKCQNERDYHKISRILYEDFVERAKDEIIAYFSHRFFDETDHALGLTYYDGHIKELENTLSERNDMTQVTKDAIVDKFRKDRQKCYKMVRRIRHVAEKLYIDSYDGMIEQDKAEALLRNTPGIKIHRLAKFIRKTKGDITSLW